MVKKRSEDPVLLPVSDANLGADLLYDVSQFSDVVPHDYML